MKRRVMQLDDIVILDDDDLLLEQKKSRTEKEQGVIRYGTPVHHHDIQYEATYEPDSVELAVELAEPSSSKPILLGYPTASGESPTFSSNSESDATSDAAAQSISATKYYYDFIHRTAEQCKEEGEAPQRSDAWKRARQFAITGSDFGSAVGHNPHCSPNELLKKKLWETFQGNSATRWGTANEPRAAEAFLAYAKANISEDAILIEKGLIKFTDMPWIGVSPDGFLLYKKDGRYILDLVEYKCPTRYETDDHPYAKYASCTPPYYRDQMLGIWGYLNSHGGIALSAAETGTEAMQLKLGNAWFVVWQPKTLWIVPHSFEEKEWESLLLDLRKFYFGKFLPCLVWVYEGKLARGSIEPDRDAIVIDE